MALSLCNSLELPKPSHWPVSMAGFGKNPKGEPLYRVVLASTVFKLIFGTGPDGTTGAHIRPAYRHIGKKWIIEKWLSGWETTKMTPREYQNYGPRDPQSGMLLEGPYPADGVYHHCWTFEGENPEISSIEKIIGLIRKGEGKSLAQIKAENKAIDEKEEKRANAERFMRVRETEPLYGIRPASFAGTPKSVNHKTQRTPIAANELKLPYKRGSVVAMRGPTVNASI